MITIRNNLEKTCYYLLVLGLLNALCHKSQFNGQSEGRAKIEWLHSYSILKQIKLVNNVYIKERL